MVMAVDWHADGAADGDDGNAVAATGPLFVDAGLLKLATAADLLHAEQQDIVGDEAPDGNGVDAAESDFDYDDAEGCAGDPFDEQQPAPAAPQGVAAPAVAVAAGGGRRHRGRGPRPSGRPWGRAGC